MSKSAKGLVILLGSFTILVLLGWGVASAADSALPGDSLYPIDQLSESVQKVLIINPVSELDFEIDLAEERISELEALEVQQAEETLISEAIAEVEAQEALLQEKQRTMIETGLGEGGDQAVKERVMSRLEQHLELHLQKMEQVKTKLQQKGNEDAVKALENSMEKFQQGKQNAIDSVDNNQQQNGNKKGGNQQNKK